MAYFAVSTDTPQKNKEFAESLGADFPILADPDQKAAEPYGVLMPIVGLPKRWTFYIGKDGKILFVDKDVKVGSAGADIAAKLAELGVARRPVPSPPASPRPGAGAAGILDAPAPARRDPR